MIGKVLMNWCFGWIKGRLRSDASAKRDALDDDFDDTFSTKGSQLPLRRPADLEPQGLPLPKPLQRCPQQGGRPKR